MSSFTCNTCGLAFQSSAGQKEHMKSDWHRYNLKRRVAALPPIDMETFSEKVSKMSIVNHIDEQLTDKEKRRLKKEEIYNQKMDLLRKAREQIIRRQEQAEEQEERIEEQKEPITEPIEEAKGSEETVEEEAATEVLLQQKLKNQNAIPPTTCFFCKKRSFKDAETNVLHMFKNHGLYIPEKKYLVDLNGLLTYLGEKIGLGNVCLSCNYQGKNLEAVKAHMESKQHCRLPYESEDEKLEISDFYDFSSTYKGSNENVNEEDWEDVDEEDVVDDDIKSQVEESEVLYSDGVELYLPTGIKIGHRSMNRYFKQDLKPEKILTEGQGTVITAETRHLVNVISKKELAIQKRVWNNEIKDRKTHDKRAAKFINNQPHFRDPLLQ